MRKSEIVQKIQKQKIPSQRIAINNSLINLNRIKVRNQKEFENKKC